MRQSAMRIAMLVAVFSFGLATAQADFSWNAYDQFNTTAGTNDSSQTWQYFRGSAGSNSDYQLLTAYILTYPGYDGWRQPVPTSGGDVTELPYITKVVSAGEIQVHPGNLEDPSLIEPLGQAVIGWKAPAAGTYSVSLSLIDRSSSEGDGFDYGLYKQGVSEPLSSGTYDNGGSSGAINLSNIAMSAGQMLYLNVGHRGTVQADLTGVYFQISSVPEPSAIALGGLGLVALLAYAWRKRK